MIKNKKIPVGSYGIIKDSSDPEDLNYVIEEIRRQGYSIFDPKIKKNDLNLISEHFDLAYSNYVKKWGLRRLNTKDEINTIRALLTYKNSIFIKLATNLKLIKIIKNLIKGKFILNQQNGIINPYGKNFSQSKWHRDLPYQHFISSRPLAISALFCVDNFTENNGATFVLPYSHKFENFPKKKEINEKAIQVTAKSGQFIIFDSMLFHCAGINISSKKRRGINHVYTIPYFKQQINLVNLIKQTKMTSKEKELLGFNNQEPNSIEIFFRK